MKFVTLNGAIWRLSNNNFRVLARQMRKGEGYDLDALGVMVIDQFYRLDEVVDEAAFEAENAETPPRVRPPRLRNRRRGGLR